MKLDYRWGANEQYCEETDEMIGDTICYTYEPDYDELRLAIHKIFSQIFKVSIASAEQIIDEFDLQEQCENYFEEDLKEYFEEDAYNEYNDR